MLRVAQPVSVNTKHSAKTKVKFISPLPNALHKSSDADLTSPQPGLCIQRTKGVAGHPHPDTISVTSTSGREMQLTRLMPS